MWIVTRRCLLLACCLALAATMPLAARTSWAAELSTPAVQPAPVAVTLRTQLLRDGAVILSATLRNAGGTPIPDQKLTFYVDTEFFIRGDVLVGTGTTDGSGVARIHYRPSWTGVHGFSARFAGKDELASGEGFGELVLQKITAQYDKEPPDLDRFRRGVGKAALGLSVTVVLVLFGVLLRVVRGVYRAGAADDAGRR